MLDGELSLPGGAHELLATGDDVAMLAWWWHRGYEMPALMF